MKQIELYETAINEMIKEFTIRLYNELYKEKTDDLDIQNALDGIIGNREIGIGPVEINDMFFSIEDMYITLANKIPLYVVENYYNDSLEVHYNKKPLGINLINYWKRIKYTKKELEKQEEEDLKKSKENVKYAEKELEKTVLKLNKKLGT